jgi:hypothetical protein
MVDSRGFLVRPRGLRIAGTLAILLGNLSCTSKSIPEPEPAVESDEVHCDACGKRVSRQSAEPHVSPEGLDVYVCKPCLSKPAQGKLRSSPPARTSR